MCPQFVHQLLICFLPLIGGGLSVAGQGGSGPPALMSCFCSPAGNHIFLHKKLCPVLRVWTSQIVVMKWLWGASWVQSEWKRQSSTTLKTQKNSYRRLCRTPASWAQMMLFCPSQFVRCHLWPHLEQRRIIEEVWKFGSTWTFPRLTKRGRMQSED